SAASVPTGMKSGDLAALSECDIGALRLQLSGEAFGLLGCNDVAFESSLLDCIGGIQHQFSVHCANPSGSFYDLDRVFQQDPSFSPIEVKCCGANLGRLSVNLSLPRRAARLTGGVQMENDIFVKRDLFFLGVVPGAIGTAIALRKLKSHRRIRPSGAG